MSLRVGDTKSYPSTETVHLKVGQHLPVRFIRSNSAVERARGLHLSGDADGLLQLDHELLISSDRLSGVVGLDKQRPAQPQRLLTVEVGVRVTRWTVDPKDKVY